jgi:kynurenine formamidase
MIVDLSHRLEPGMPAYPGLPIPQFHTFMAHEDAARHGKYAPGTSFQIASYELGGNTGTYVDAPFHRHPAGADLADVPLEHLADVPGILVDAHEGAIGAEFFAGLNIKHQAVMVHTGWSKRWGGDYFRSGPFLTAKACEEIVRGGATLVGIDCANIDDMNDSARPAHTILLAANIPVVEHLRGLDELRGKRFKFFAVPPAIRGGTSFPVRAFALCE